MPEKCSVCNDPLRVEPEAFICERRDGSDEGQYHDYWMFIDGEWRNEVPTPVSAEIQELRRRLRALERRMGAV